MESLSKFDTSSKYTYSTETANMQAMS